MSFDPNSFNRKLCKMGMKVTNGIADVSLYPSVSIHREKAESAQEWCQQHFGDEWVWGSPINTDLTNLYFMTDEDKLLFKLSFATT